MKLLYLTNGVAGCGGLERVLSSKTNFFIEEYNYDISVITLNEANGDRFFEFNQNIHFYNIEQKSKNKVNRYLHYIREVSRIVSETKPDIFLVCDDGVKGLYVPVWLRTSAKLVYERHAALELNSDSKIIQQIMILASKNYDKFVVLTPSCKKTWGDNNHVSVIPNPLAILPNKQSSLRFGRGICVGSLNHNKGYDLLIDALAQVPETNWHVDVYGRGPYTHLLDKAQKQSISYDQLCFKGESNNIDHQYLTADFLILPSRTEGFGMVLIEAMSYGLPCIAFDCPNGPRYIIENGKNGFLVDSENTSDLADAITEMLRLSDSQKAKFSQNALKTSQRYAIKNISEQWRQLFQTLKSL